MGEAHIPRCETVLLTDGGKSASYAKGRPGGTRAGGGLLKIEPLFAVEVIIQPKDFTDEAKWFK